MLIKGIQRLTAAGAESSLGGYKLPRSVRPSPPRRRVVQPPPPRPRPPGDLWAVSNSPESYSTSSVLLLVSKASTLNDIGHNFKYRVFHCSDGKESACNARDLGSIPGSGRSPGKGNGYLLKYSYVENSMDRGAWQTIVHGVTKSQTWLSN